MSSLPGGGSESAARHTLLLRLAGPMQSWGTQSHFARRDTGLEPSKSGVVGLLCAALGRGREESVDDLAALRMGVRVDHEGTLQVDYQTAGGVRRGDTSGYGVAEFGGGVRAVISRRAYLSDARFLVGLEASSLEQRQVLQRLDAALARPVWPLFLGRRAFVHAESVRLPDAPPLGPGLRPLPLREALLTYPWPDSSGLSESSQSSESSKLPVSLSEQALRFVLEEPSRASGEHGVREGDGDGDGDGEGGDETRMEQVEMRLDTPISFAPLDRRYAPRFVHVEFHTRPDRDPA